MRAVLALAAVLTACAVPALANEAADREIIGFSADGRYFAFEEYGIQDGSGFPYSNIYIIDATDDSWVPDSPIRVLIEGEGGQLPLFETRSEARALAAELLESVGLPAFPIGIDRTLLLVSNPVAELSADPHRAVFTTYPLRPPLEAPYTLTIVEHDATTPHDYCDPFWDPRGFTLTLQQEGGQPRVLHADGERLPESRQCALDYAISDVVTMPVDAFAPFSGEGRAFAVLISVFRVGFEGPDRRFLAVTGRF